MFNKYEKARLFFLWSEFCRSPVQSLASCVFFTILISTFPRSMNNQSIDCFDSF